ncbi:MAG: IS30 family transposase, partial [Clostridia bacterium]|nr:IS30 family transposase [Clostridia bacterium]
MAQKEYSTKGREFQHLTIEKRAQIEILLRMKVPKSQIAKMVGIARSTLYNELARGSVVQLDSELRQYTRYFSDVGQRVYEEHRENSRPPLKLAKAYEFVAYAEQQMLEEKLAPETICGVARRNGMFSVTVCAKTLYNYIDQCLLRVRNIDLLLKVKRRQHVHHARQHKHLFGMSIEERPAVVNNREEFGHWEIDTVVGN